MKKTSEQHMAEQVVPT